MMYYYYYVNDIMGWVGEMYQLVENCVVIWRNEEFFLWDFVCLDFFRIIKLEVLEDQQVDGLIVLECYLDYKVG